MIADFNIIFNIMYCFNIFPDTNDMKMRRNNMFGLEMTIVNKQLFMGIVNDTEIYQKRFHSLVRWPKDPSVH